MIPPAVKGYGTFDVETFDEYYARWPTELSNFPACVVENWVYRHWADFESLWVDKGVESFTFSEATLTNNQILAVGHTGDWLETLDYWGDELMRDKQRQETWLARYMLTHGTTPAPIIVAPHVSGLAHPRGLAMVPNQLIEGHMRLAYLRGMIRYSHSELKPDHAVWHLGLPRSSFQTVGAD